MFRAASQSNGRVADKEGDAGDAVDTMDNREAGVTGIPIDRRRAALT